MTNHDSHNLSTALDALRSFIAQHSGILVLTGAGVSLSSGIPTYRNNDGVWARNAPIQHRDFLLKESSRRRYWARSFAGWPAVKAALPNCAHQALVQMEAQGIIRLLVTQNIDRLHQRAGQRRVIDLHGRLDQVICMACGAGSLREHLQQRLAQMNPHLQRAAALAPDGDADVEEAQLEQLKIPECLQCGGILKPDVVFFGDSVNRQTVEEINQSIVAADAMLVIGSSLMVFSGFRFCRLAAERGIPLACINPGTTRADNLFSLKVAADCGPVLTQLAGI